MPPGPNGVGALSERFAVYSTEAEDCGEGAGEAEMCWVVSKLRSSLMSGEVGIGGWGMTMTDEFDADGNVSCVAESD